MQDVVVDVLPLRHRDIVTRRPRPALPPEDAAQPTETREPGRVGAIQYDGRRHRQGNMALGTRLTGGPNLPGLVKARRHPADPADRRAAAGPGPHGPPCQRPRSCLSIAATITTSTAGCCAPGDHAAAGSATAPAGDPGPSALGWWAMLGLAARLRRDAPARAQRLAPQPAVASPSPRANSRGAPRYLSPRPGTPFFRRWRSDDRSGL